MGNFLISVIKWTQIHNIVEIVKIKTKYNTHTQYVYETAATKQPSNQAAAHSTNESAKQQTMRHKWLAQCIHKYFQSLINWIKTTGSINYTKNKHVAYANDWEYVLKKNRPESMLFERWEGSAGQSNAAIIHENKFNMYDIVNGVKIDLMNCELCWVNSSSSMDSWLFFYYSLKRFIFNRL